MKIELTANELQLLLSMRCDNDFSSPIIPTQFDEDYEDELEDRLNFHNISRSRFDEIATFFIENNVEEMWDEAEDDAGLFE